MDPEAFNNKILVCPVVAAISGQSRNRGRHGIAGEGGPLPYWVGVDHHRLWRGHRSRTCSRLTISDDTGGMRWILVFALLPFASAQTWELLGDGYQLTADSAVDPEGNVYFTDVRRNRILKIDLDGKIRVWKEDSHGTHGVAWGPDGRLYGGQHDRKRIVAFSSDGAEKVIAEGEQSHHLKVSSRNEVYFTVPPAHKVWMVDAAGDKRLVHEGLNWPRSVAVSSDRKMLMLNDPPTKWVWRFDVAADGSLRNGRQFCGLATRGGSLETDAGGMTFDVTGHLYVATKQGVQVCDGAGKVIQILDTPGTEGVSNVFFAGPGLQWLYVTAWEKVYRRPFNRLMAK